ncbi:L-proline 4-hydroxylase [Streptomyces sp. NBRC 14336]|uniref:phytanoyl-CoA dioxygenase family protein n=1 Tax=Streptomyces sp. NBRC 14336 TaxID=3030992 RepID=UPI0024A3B12E|nr:phytanoyl-CoA dioxygenase family protein [Streptomyces sp. NBRC 14336]WBO76190.1 phytanoyl-CoA dioxygenase family protein [Streptomyces sp. SBE_14.2]GLW46784.1 L-proline 4-hydroxylase [Streptomyces sp. NBRC 14336]
MSSHLQRAAYADQGWCPAPHSLPPDALAKVRASVRAIAGSGRPEVVYEEGTRTVRALHGCHRYDPVCAELVRHPALVDLARALIGGPVYLYQFKVNMKSPREGRAWPWHQDYAFWAHEDGMPEPAAVNIALHLDDVHEGNGPLTVLPGSHTLGLVPTGEAGGRSWRDHVSARLAHAIPPEEIDALTAKFPPRPILGPAGTVAAFHPSIVHSSTNNTSDDRRAVLLLTYNSVTNAPTRLTRPAFLVDPDTTPVRRLENALT